MRTIAAVLFVLLLFPVVSKAQVTVVREGSENPVLTVAKSIFWGGVAGLMLGGATALVVDDNKSDVVKWFFVGGTFAGFGFGVYHVLNRERPSSAMFRIDERGPAIDWPEVALTREEEGWRADALILAIDF